MSVEAQFFVDDGSLPLTAGAAYSCGEVIQLSDGRAGVIQGLKDVASGEAVEVATEGLFYLACATGTTFSAGDKVVWDSSANLAITAHGESADFYVGTAVLAKASGPTVVLVDLNAFAFAQARTIQVSTSLVATAAATAANYGGFFIANKRYLVKKISENHSVAGSDGSAVTLTVERLQGTEALDAGDDLLDSTKIDLKGTANTRQSPALTPTVANLILEVGDRLALKDSGTLTAVAGVSVSVELEELI